MRRYKCLISYDGTAYVGWQNQLTGTSIQQLIGNALVKFLGHPVTLVGASRTDSGVHALAQAAHFCTEKEVDARRFIYGINTMLPRDIRIKSLEEVDETFHAQYSALGKLYHYHLYLAKEDDPFTRLYHHHIPYSISLPLLKEALQTFVGTHDFTSFANCGSSAKTFVRTIFRMDLEEEGLNRYRIACEGNGFLYKMVRNIVGASLMVAKGRLTLEDLKQILESKDRKKAPPPAPAHGLCLIYVKYEAKLTSSSEEN